MNRDLTADELLFSVQMKLYLRRSAIFVLRIQNISNSSNTLTPALYNPLFVHWKMAILADIPLAISPTRSVLIGSTLLLAIACFFGNRILTWYLNVRCALPVKEQDCRLTLTFGGSQSTLECPPFDP